MYLGISFYVFQCTGYLIDVYRHKYEPERNILRYMLFASFFLQIGQGPIGRYDRLSKTLYEPHKFDYDRFTTGAIRVLIGFFKKAVIADNLAMVVDTVCSSPSDYCGLIIVIISFLYSLQIYADFSGYMDIVIGVGLQLGVSLDENFLTPYFATSIRDFWQRWHITLSTWLRDYVYIPLGGNRKGIVRKCVNQMITMIISGIWHGTGLNFIIWGGLHGICQVVENFLPGYRDKKEPRGFVKYLRILLTLITVDIAWMFFRLPDLSTVGIVFHQITSSFITDGVSWFRQIYSHDGFFRSYWMTVIGGSVILFVMELVRINKPVEKAIMSRHIVVRWIILLVLFLITLMYAFDPEITSNNFIYYQF